MAVALNAARVIRQVRQRLGLSQGDLARLLNASNGAIQHWERGRNRPGLARLLALRQFCPPSRERTQLEALICQTQAGVVSPRVAPATEGVRETRETPGPTGDSLVSPTEEGELRRLRRQVAKLHAILQGKNKQLRIFQDRTAELHRMLTSLRASHSNDPTKKISN